MGNVSQGMWSDIKKGERLTSQGGHGKHISVVIVLNFFFPFHISSQREIQSCTDLSCVKMDTSQSNISIQRKDKKFCLL